MKCQVAFQKGSDLQPHQEGCLKRQSGLQSIKTLFYFFFSLGMQRRRNARPRGAVILRSPADLVFQLQVLLFLLKYLYII